MRCDARERMEERKKGIMEREGRLRRKRRRDKKYITKGQRKKNDTKN